MAEHYISPMRVILFTYLVLLLSIADFSDAQKKGSYIPDILDVSAIDNRYLFENITLGTVLGTIKAVDRDNTQVSYNIQNNGGKYFACNPDTGVVTLKKLLDFETEIEIKSLVYVVDQNGQSNTRACKVFVSDVNDNPPVFTDTAIVRNISENAPIGYIVTQIVVNDLDTVNAALKVVCGGNTTLFLDACDTFHVVVANSTNKYWIGFLVLNKSLDYETRIAYDVLLIASDGNPDHDVINEVHIEVQDANSTPPKWSYVGPKYIPEEEPTGTSIQQVTAQDGDSTKPRQIFYELFGLYSDVFQIGNRSGIISNAKRLDYDSNEHQKGVPYDINVRAREIINNATGDLGNDSTTTATITVQITVEDINDNPPVFSETDYTVYIEENTISGANVPGLQMTVTDNDSGDFNSFDLVTLNNTDVFGIIPSRDAASSSATLFVIDGKKLDYEVGPRQYIISVHARQNFVNPHMFTGSATVTIYTKDVNDITPRFGSEYYNLTVSEIALPGTVIIDLIATDPEEGDFGTAGIRYRMNGDTTPSHFQIDAITGIVTVAPCNPPNQPGITPCIDYERKQDYTLTVSATDNREQPGSRSRSVQLFIKVLDENDNPPKLDDKCIRYIYEDQTVTINPLLIDPVDPDTVDGPMTFTLTADASGLWQISPLTDSTGRQFGNITAIRPIKYRDARYPDGQFKFAVVVAVKSDTNSAPEQTFVIKLYIGDPFFTARFKNLYSGDPSGKS